MTPSSEATPVALLRPLRLGVTSTDPPGRTTENPPLLLLRRLRLRPNAPTALAPVPPRPFQMVVINQNPPSPASYVVPPATLAKPATFVEGSVPWPPTTARTGL